jgi:hypothetical protein
MDMDLQFISQKDSSILSNRRNTEIKTVRQTFCPVSEGECVWLEAQNLKLPHHKKILTKTEGPLEIKEVMGPVTYRLYLLTQWKIHNVFHANLLSPFIEAETQGPNFMKPPPDIVEGHETRRSVHPIYLTPFVSTQFLFPYSDLPRSSRCALQPRVHQTHQRNILLRNKLRRHMGTRSEP